jgi:hypothetical protein
MVQLSLDLMMITMNRTGDPFGSPNADDSMFGVTTTTDNDPSGGLYGAGRFGYSINETSSIVTAETGSQPTAAQVNYDSAYSGSAAYKMVTVNVPTNADLYAVRSFTLTCLDLQKLYQYKHSLQLQAITLHLSL